MCSDMAWLDKEHFKQAIVVSQGGGRTERLLFAGIAMYVVHLKMVHDMCFCCLERALEIHRL